MDRPAPMRPGGILAGICAALLLLGCTSAQPRTPAELEQQYRPMIGELRSGLSQTFPELEWNPPQSRGVRDGSSCTSQLWVRGRAAAPISDESRLLTVTSKVLERHGFARVDKFGDARGGRRVAESIDQSGARFALTSSGAVDLAVSAPASAGTCR